MKLMKKQAFANIESQPTISHFSFADSAFVDALLSFCLHKLDNLVNRINEHFLIHGKVGHVESKLKHSRQPSTTSPTASNNASGIHWAPLIKSKTQNLNLASQNCYLTGYSVLCIGGRARLYPQYQQLIEDSGGKLLTFHGSSSDNLGRLSQLLDQTDMIICPIDCINHEAFLIVKHYCQCSGKPCILLDRSETNTFRAGVNMLSLLCSTKNLER
ncbi:MAG: DUF2325 domain-containing protein [Nitrosomonas sp. PRO4]|nr:DUF2325 domain-containing protein [Nitrosomonas sp. PRO4]